MVRLVLDISITRERKGRPAVGIARVEREIIKAIFSRLNARFVYFDQVINNFRCYPKGALGSIVLEEYHTDKIVEICPTSYSHPFDFEAGDIYINCGMPWGQRLLEVLYSRKNSFGIRSIQVVYDIIPLRMPELCPPGMSKAFGKLIVDAAWTSDAIYCISQCTKDDLLRHLASAGCPQPQLRIMRMGVDLIAPSSKEVVPHKAAPKPDSGFVIYVSTLEPRKNHLMVFNIWQDLYLKLGDKLPTLIFIGEEGWNTKDLRYFIENSLLRAASKILVISHLDDNDLDFYYRNCLFCLYPSLYEGWGLPVSEALAYGKFCVASNVSSIPEAGQGLVDLLDPRDYILWRDRCLHYILDRAELQDREKSIVERRRNFTWRWCADEFLDDICENLVDDVVL